MSSLTNGGESPPPFPVRLLSDLARSQPPTGCGLRASRGVPDSPREPPGPLRQLAQEPAHPLPDSLVGQLQLFVELLPGAADQDLRLGQAQRLYRAKSGGRNQVVVNAPPAPPPR